MASFSNGDDSKPPKLSQRLSETFLRPAKPKGSVPRAEPGRVLSPPERRKAMRAIDAVEIKWSKAGLIVATAFAIFLPFYAKTALHSTTDKSKSVTTEALLLGGGVLVFCLLGLYGLLRRKRTLLAF